MDKYPQLPPESAAAELFGDRVRNSPFRVGDLLITSMGTWVIVGDYKRDHYYEGAMGYIWVAHFDCWRFTSAGIGRDERPRDRIFK